MPITSPSAVRAVTFDGEGAPRRARVCAVCVAAAEAWASGAGAAASAVASRAPADPFSSPPRAGPGSVLSAFFGLREKYSDVCSAQPQDSSNRKDSSQILTIPHLSPHPVPTPFN